MTTTVTTTPEQPSAAPLRRGDAATAVNGARWFASANLLVGALNYAYALILTRLLSPAAFDRFAAGQSLLLCASAVSVVAVPWVLAQELARATHKEDEDSAVVFAIVTSVAGGLIAGLTVGLIALQFAGLLTAVVTALGTLLIYVTRVTVGWLQGNERMRPMAGIAVTEALIKVLAGLALVTVAHLGDVGALGAFGLGVLPYLVYWPWHRGSGHWSWRRLRSRTELWRRAGGIASLQGLVSVMASADLVLVAVLSAGAADAAGYQASAALGRTPFFIADAVAMAFFPALSRRTAGTPLAACAVRMYAAVTLPILAVCATVPTTLVTTAFPKSFASSSGVMPYTAITGFALGGISLTVLFFQAVNDYSIRRTQCVGVVVYATALLAGWRIGGVHGLAAGAACGSVAVLALVVSRLVKSQGVAVLTRVRLLEPLVLAGVLILLRPYALLWLVGAVLVGVCAIWRFFNERVSSQEHDRTAPTRGPGEGRGRIVISGYDDAMNSSYCGGGAVVIEQIARRLSQHYAVTVLTAGRTSGTRTSDGVEFRSVPVCWAGPRGGQLLFQASLPMMARKLRYDLWLESFTPPFSSGFLPLFSRGPVIGIDQVRSGEAMWHKYHLPFFLVERISFRCYRRLVALSDSDRAVLQRYSPRSEVHVISNGVEPRPVAADAFGKGEFILFLGRIDAWQKGLDLLLAAYSQAEPDLPLVLAGAGTKGEERLLQDMLARHHREVTWLGRVNGQEKEEVLRGSAFMVMPSRHETFGLVALESMSYGKPVVHFDLPCLRWMNGEGDVGVAPFEVDALAAEIRRLDQDDRARTRLGQQAHLTSQKHSWEAMTGQYLELVQAGLATPSIGAAEPTGGGLRQTG